MNDSAPSSSVVARRNVTVANPKGLHARPAAKVAKLVQTFDATVTVRFDGDVAEAESIMDLLMLGAAPGADLEIEADGPDAEAAVAAVARMIENGFGEI